MARTTLKMPQLGESVTEGTVERWLKAEGEMVRRDEPIVEVVTDKVNAEIPSPFEGRLVRINVVEGQTVAIGAALAELEVEGAQTSAEETASPKEPASAPKPAVRAATRSSGEKMSPAVRRQAHLARQAAATGDDAAAAVPAPATGSGAREELVKVSAVRRE